MVELESFIKNLAKNRYPLNKSQLWEPKKYAEKRPLILKHMAEIKKLLRIELDEHLTILFENRATVWFQIQEELRWHDIVSEETKNSIFNCYNQLLSDQSTFHVTLFLNSENIDIIKLLTNHLKINDLDLSFSLNGYLWLKDEAIDELEPVNFVRFKAAKKTNLKSTFHWDLTEKKEKEIKPELLKLLSEEESNLSLSISA